MKPPIKFLPLVVKYVVRRPVRSLLTMSGVAAAMFLFCSVQAMRNGLTEATGQTPEDARLVVYRQDRYCPFTSELPQNYASKIAKIPGVKAVTPMKILVSNCRAGLDVVAFRGVPPAALDEGFLKNVNIVDGSVENWKRRSDSALIGKRLAKRRRLKVGDRIAIAGIAITVAGVIDSTEAQDQNVAYAHLDYVQRAADKKVGIVTQFAVDVDEPAQSENVARAIDAEFKTAQAPTSTWPEKAFVARTATDIIEIVNFAVWLGWGCVAGVFALVFNAIVLSTRDRVRDHAVMQTLGFSQLLIAGLIITESLFLSLSGGLIGVLAAAAVVQWSSFSLSMEGVSIHVHAGLGAVLLGLGISALTGILAGLIPSLQAARRDVAVCFRAV